MNLFSSHIRKKMTFLPTPTSKRHISPPLDLPPRHVAHPALGTPPQPSAKAYTTHSSLYPCLDMGLEPDPKLDSRLNFSSGLNPQQNPDSVHDT